MFPGDESFCLGDVVEQCEGVEVWAGGDGFAVGLEDVFLGLKQIEVCANMVEDIGFLVLIFL